MNETPILGPGPHKLDWRANLGMHISGLACVLTGALVILGFGAAQADSVAALLVESDIWENGAVAPQANVREDWTSSGAIIDSYNLTVDWVDESGAHQESAHGFSTLFFGVTEGESMEVRYVPAGDGYVIATSWGESVRWSRWAAAVAAFLFGLVFAALAILLGLGVMKRGRRTARMLKDFDEVWLRVVNVIEDKSDGAMEHVFVLFDEAKESEFMERFKKGPPFMLGPDEGHVLALRGRSDDLLLVLRHDLYPLVKNESATSEIRNRAALPRTNASSDILNRVSRSKA